jgi:hypothetical protein
LLYDVSVQLPFAELYILVDVLRAAVPLRVPRNWISRRIGMMPFLLPMRLAERRTVHSSKECSHGCFIGSLFVHKWIHLRS